MMKLQYLHDNRNMVHDILNRWENDADRLDWLDRYRISSNAVYPFSSGGKPHFLRFAPVSQKRNGQLQAEQDWLVFLQQKGIAANRMVPSKAGNLLEHVDTVWGVCIACVFEGVAGQRYDWMDWDPLPVDALHAAGETLARLHVAGDVWMETASAARQPWHWSAVLDWCEQLVRVPIVLPEGALGVDEARNPWPETTVEPTEVRQTASRLRERFAALPTTPEVFGPVHYDFEMDNLFWQPEEERCVPIDFDDLMLHWYALDLIKARESIFETLAEAREEAGAASDDPVWSEAAQKAETCLFEGYRSVRAIPEHLLAQAPAFSQFAALYGYARILNALRQVNPEEPEWMTGLRTHLRDLLAQRKEIWGQTP